MKKREFSKTLLIQESVLVWVTTLVCLALGVWCVYLGYTSSLPWISSIIVSVYAAYGVSQAMYYRKAMAENTTGGVKYESVLEEINQAKELYSNISESVESGTYVSSTEEYQI